MFLLELLSICWLSCVCLFVSMSLWTALRFASPVTCPYTPSQKTAPLWNKESQLEAANSVYYPTWYLFSQLSLTSSATEPNSSRAWDLSGISGKWQLANLSIYSKHPEARRCFLCECVLWFQKSRDNVKIYVKLCLLFKNGLIGTDIVKCKFMQKNMYRGTFSVP